jgi:tetratricopeptide (TPR) repeat protein
MHSLIAVERNATQEVTYGGIDHRPHVLRREALCCLLPVVINQQESGKVLLSSGITLIPVGKEINIYMIIRFSCLLLVLMFSNSAFAETKTFIKEYTYQASELDSRSSGRMLALEQVKRLLLEELGVFLTSQTEVVDSQLTKDKIVSITAGIVSATVLDETWDGHQFWLKAKIAADPKQVFEAIKAVVNDVKKSESLEAANKKISELQIQLDVVKNTRGASETERQQEYNKIIDKITVTDMLREYWNFAYNETGEMTKAKSFEHVKILSQIISKDNSFAEAYFIRGSHYVYIEMPNEAISDLLQAIKLKHNYPDQAYGMLAQQYKKLRQYDKYLDVLYKSLSKGNIVFIKHYDAIPPLNEKEYAQLSKKMPNDFRLHLARSLELFRQVGFGQKHYNDKKYVALFLSTVKLAIKLNNDEPVAYLMLSEHYRDYLMPFMDMDKYEILVKDCIKYASIGLQHAKTPGQTVEFLFMLANYGKGVISDRSRMNYYERLVVLEPNSTIYLKDLAKLKRGFDMFNEALYLYNRILEIDSTKDYERLYETYKEIGNTYIEMGEIELAINMYNKAVDDMDVHLSKYAADLKTDKKNDSTTNYLSNSLKSYKAKLLDTINMLKRQSTIN